MAKSKTAPRTKRSSKSTSSKSDAGLQAKAEHLSRSIVESAQHIWLAGVGAFGRAQEEGTRMFEALVKEGMNIEKSTRHIAGDRVEAVRDAMEERVGSVRDRASDTWDRLEKVFEQRVQRALTKLGVPGSKELQDLIGRVNELNAQLRKLAGVPSKSKPAAKKATAKKAAAKKATAKKTTAKKATVKKAVAKKPTAKKAASKAPTAKKASKTAPRKKATLPKTPAPSAPTSTD
ncbi:MAG: phasin family protein [Xanthomonadaceae bacterium]|nr:phasin family protein [Xanthomonadaceae bacterium]